MDTTTHILSIIEVTQKQLELLNIKKNFPKNNKLNASLSRLRKYVDESLALLQRIVSRTKKFQSIYDDENLSILIANEINDNIDLLLGLHANLLNSRDSFSTSNVEYDDYAKLLSSLETILNYKISDKKNIEKENINLKNKLNEKDSELEKLVLNYNIEIKRLHDDLSQLKKRVESEIQSAKSRHNTIISDEKKLINKRKNDFYSEIDEKTKKISEIIKNKKDKLEEDLRKFDNLIGLISGEVIAKEHSQYADEEKKETDKYRNISIAILFIAFFIAIIFLFQSSTKELEIGNIILRIGALITMGIPVAYMARESQKHRNQQYQYRKTDLDLKSISPYIISLEKEKQENLKVEIAHKIFGQPAIQDKDSYPIDVQDLITEAIRSTKNNLKNKKKETTDN